VPRPPADSGRILGPWRAAARATWPRARPVAPLLAVPAYFHPAAAPQDWERLVRQADQIRLVVLNPASGPGDGLDPAFLAAIAPLQAAGVAIVGYVDTSYGRRPSRAALAEVSRYLRWYQVDGIMFDQVSPGPDDLRHYAQLSRRARKLGAEVIVFNHGVHPHEGYARHADVLGTFEGPWSVYLEQAVPKWTRSWPAERFYHVVYSVPPGHLADAIAVAGHRRAGCVYVTDESGGNPYSRLPTPMPAAAARPAR
jgi:Spherulation-specific family 4